jgi:GYF domain 2
MARERWFFAQGNQRRGPVPFNNLVESVLGQAEPRTVLVWRKGFADWTRAEDVPEVERRLAPFLARKAAEEAAKRGPAPASVDAAPARPIRVEEAKPGSPALVYGGIAAGIAVLGLLAWLFWPRAQPPAPAPTALPLGGTTTDNSPAVVIPAHPQPTPAATQAPVATPTPPPVTRPTPAPTAAAAAALSDKESELSASDIKRLRGVATWSGDTLKLTVYNGTAWRVTELFVKVSRFKDDDFVEDPRALVLLPPGAAVDAGVADLLSRVAPDRKKPGLNPADTGPFEGKAGQQPENFRWEIESARGYSPR